LIQTKYLMSGPQRIGSVYKKAVYRQYTDEQFSIEVEKPGYLGFLGPVIRAEVNDEIVVHMKNFASRPYSLHPHGVFYEKDSEGALYPDGTSGKNKNDDAVAPGESYKYTWKVKEEFAPTENDSKCLTWIYHSHVDAPKDIAAGLIGVLLTCKKGNSPLDSKGLRSDVDHEFFLMFSVVDENLSWYFDDNIKSCCSDTDNLDADEEFQESNLLHSINGFVYGNLPPIDLCVGHSVSWHLFGIGNEVDIHSAYFHGHTLLDRGHRTDVLSLFPASFVTAVMVPKTPGKWRLSCQVNDHMRAGMQMFYQVSLCGNDTTPKAPSGHERHYYIAAEEHLWDYAPSGKNVLTDKPLNATNSDSEQFFTNKGGKLGGRYWKARYVQYSDSTFQKKLSQHGSEQHLGILGPVIRAETGDVIVVTFKNMAKRAFSMQPHGLHYDKVYEGTTYQDVMDENESWYLTQNINQFGSSETDPNDEEFQESNKMHSVNGFMYGNLPGLDLCEGDHVVWHTLGLGTEVDLHGVYFQGNTFQQGGTTRDTLSLFPHTSVTVSMIPNNDGSFELSCLTTDHHRGGMRHIYTVKQCLQSQNPVTTFQPDRIFYLAAEEVVWNYAPNRTWELEKHNATLEHRSVPGSVYLNKSESQIGPEYKKVVFHQYMDATFTNGMVRGPNEEHLGILGPILRMEVGEKIQVVFKNKATGSFSVHAHGVKTSEAHLKPVSQGGVMKYNWTVTASPGPAEPNCITFAYYSSANFVKDLASGLVGPLVVCRKGTLKQDNQRRDVDKDFALLFMVFDENESWYLEENIRTYLKKDPKTFNADDEQFIESNMMHGINGKLYANLHGLNMTKGDRTEWYLIGLGNEIDMHTVHFHAQSFVYKVHIHSYRADVYDLFPGTFQTVELVAGTPGTWLLHCHVTDHIHAGMETTFTIFSK
uniref:ferroxidase n=1 Tax=Pygocentrus nattereri TaxID=42514 RepID=A0AAR2L1U4_PYGNA